MSGRSRKKMTAFLLAPILMDSPSRDGRRIFVRPQGATQLPYSVVLAGAWRAKREPYLGWEDRWVRSTKFVASPQTHLSIMRLPLKSIDQKKGPSIGGFEANGLNWHTFGRNLHKGEFSFLSAYAHAKGWSFIVEGICRGPLTGKEAKDAFRIVRSLRPDAGFEATKAPRR